MGSRSAWDAHLELDSSGAEVLVVAVVVAVLIIALVGLRLDRRRRTPSALRGDWWAEFEQDFRAHVREREHSAERDWRRKGHGSIRRNDPGS